MQINFGSPAGILGAGVCAFILSYLGTWFAIRYALRTKLLDIPNERSAHKNVTPRGGGIGFVATITASLLVFGLIFLLRPDRQSGLPPLAFLAFAVSGTLTALVGWLDDRYSLSAMRRLAVHFLSAAIAVLPFAPGAQVSGFVLLAAIFLIAGFINFYNFMDGIDGIAGVEAVTASLTLCLLAFVMDANLLCGASAVVAGASFAFLLFNWPPAKIFMGDVGSGFLGLVFGMLTLLSIEQLQMRGFAIVVIVLSVFLVDATYTLLDRARKGQKVWHAHSEHAYQHAARRWGHKPVTSCVLLINFLWLAPLAVYQALWAETIFIAPVVAVVPLVGLTSALKRLKPNRSLA